MHDFLHALSFQNGYAFIARVPRHAAEARISIMRSFDELPAVAYRPSPRFRSARKQKSKLKNRK